MLAQRQRIVAVETVSEPCWDTPLSVIRDERLRFALEAAALGFASTQRKRGEEFIEAHDVHAYGPFDSLTDVEALLTGSIDDRHYHRVVGLGEGFGLYVINADFVVAGSIPALKGATT